MSSGGGGGQPSQTSQTQTVELPEWARPYAKETLAKTSALTGEDYRPYEGERISGFTPAQTQTQQKIMGMDVAPQMGMASGVTGAAGLASLGAGAQYGQMAAGDIGALRGAGAQYGQMATDPGSMQAYMSPYMQNVVDIQQREAMRQAGIAGTQRGGQAVRAGAFGGSRQAIMEAEAGRNLQQQLGDIQGRGLQSAFEQARQAQQFQSAGMKGTQAALSGIQAGSELGLRGPVKQPKPVKFWVNSGLRSLAKRKIFSKLRWVLASSSVLWINLSSILATKTSCANNSIRISSSASWLT
jgi:hypothetical protein